MGGFTPARNNPTAVDSSRLTQDVRCCFPLRSAQSCWCPSLSALAPGRSCYCTEHQTQHPAPQMQSSRGSLHPARTMRLAPHGTNPLRLFQSSPDPADTWFCNYFYTPSEVQFCCSHTSTGKRGCREHCFSAASSIFLYICTEFLGAAQEETSSPPCCQAARSILVSAGLPLFACLILLPSLFPSNKTSTFLQLNKLSVPRKQGQ